MKNRKETGITLIAANCELVGDIHFSDQLQVNGRISGNVIAEDNAKASVTVSERGQVSGEIRAPNVIVNGLVEGDIYSNKHVELAAKARVTGNVYYNLIEMVLGSRVDGSLVHVADAQTFEQQRAKSPAAPGSSAPHVVPEGTDSRHEGRAPGGAEREEALASTRVAALQGKTS